MCAVSWDWDNKPEGDRSTTRNGKKQGRFFMINKLSGEKDRDLSHNDFRASNASRRAITNNDGWPGTQAFSSAIFSHSSSLI